MERSCRWLQEEEEQQCLHACLYAMPFARHVCHTHGHALTMKKGRHACSGQPGAALPQLCAAGTEPCVLRFSAFSCLHVACCAIGTLGTRAKAREQTATYCY